MKIGFIGAGSMTKALTAKWHGKHEIMISGRDPEKTEATAKALGVKHGMAQDAARFGDVVVLATRSEDVLTAIEQAGGAEVFAGKLVIDINNPINIESFVTTRPDGSSLTDVIEDALPGARVAKAFNMAQAAVWEDPDMYYDGRQMVTLYTAASGAEDDVAQLITDVGAEPLLLGGNEHAYQLEAAAAMVIKFLFSGRDPHTIFNFLQPERKPVH